MRRPRSTTLILGLSLLAAATAWAATRTYTPPPQTGTIYTVINYRNSGLGTARPTSVSVTWGSFSRNGTFTPPSSGTCGLQTNAGVVVVLRHTRADQVPLTLSTDGTIVSGPIQSGAPPQLGAPCYQTASW
jgi:hypothetical protein